MGFGDWLVSREEIGTVSREVVFRRCSRWVSGISKMAWERSSTMTVTVLGRVPLVRMSDL